MKPMNTVSKLKGEHTGKRVFVIGNGPSLQKMPLEMLQSEYSIAMNRISLIYDRTEWRPDFFVCTTTNIAKPDWHRDIMRTIDLGVTTFAWEQLKEFIGERDNVHYLNCTHGMEITDSPSLEWWSDDISEHVCKFGTSMLVALQVVFYLGFDEIYIIGADLGFSESVVQKVLRYIGLNDLAQRFDTNHFLPGYGTPGASANVLNRNMVAAHRLTKAVAKRRGVKVFNATLGGNLEIYPRADFWEVVRFRSE